MKAITIILLIIVFINPISGYSQADGNSNIIDSCSKRWHITADAKISAYNIQTNPYKPDSLTLSIYINHGYYEFSNKFLDSLLLLNQYINDTDINMKNLISTYKLNIPRPPTIDGFSNINTTKDTPSYTIISQEEYLRLNALQYITDSIRYSYVTKHPKEIDNKMLLYNYLKGKKFTDSYSEITIAESNIRILTFPNFEFLYPIDSIYFTSKYIAIIKMKGKNQPHYTYIVDSYHNLFLAPGEFGYCVGLNKSLKLE